MYKFVVFAVLLVVVSARPGYLGSYPAAVSHVSRLDIHSKPVVTGYASPYYSGLGYGIGSGYGAYGANYGVGYGSAIGVGHGYPLAHSYSNRVDIHDAPVVTGYGHAGYYGGLGYGAYGWDY